MKDVLQLLCHGRRSGLGALHFPLVVLKITQSQWSVHGPKVEPPRTRLQIMRMVHGHAQRIARLEFHPAAVHHSMTVTSRNHKHLVHVGVRFHAHIFIGFQVLRYHLYAGQRFKDAAKILKLGAQMTWRIHP